MRESLGIAIARATARERPRASSTRFITRGFEDGGKKTRINELRKAVQKDEHPVFDSLRLFQIDPFTKNRYFIKKREII
jgi:hypothetical protein